MIDVLLEILVVYILQYPGATIRWLFSNKKRSIKNLVQDDPYINATVTLLCMVGLIVFIKY
jgi:hypothetical protein